MLIMYNRFHNFAARTLAAINEHERFTAVDTDEGRKKRDNDLFQVARLLVPRDSALSKLLTYML